MLFMLNTSSSTSNKHLSSEQWSLCIKLKETCFISGTLWDVLLFANSYLLWKKRWVCVLHCIMHSSFIENITSRRPSANPQRVLGLIQREFHFKFILRENKYLVALCRLQKHSPTSEEFGNSNKDTNHTGQKTSAALASTGSTQVIAITWQAFEPMIKPVEATAMLPACNMWLRGLTAVLLLRLKHKVCWCFFFDILSSLFCFRYSATFTIT